MGGLGTPLGWGLGDPVSISPAEWGLRLPLERDDVAFSIWAQGHDKRLQIKLESKGTTPREPTRTPSSQTRQAAKFRAPSI